MSLRLILSSDTIPSFSFFRGTVHRITALISILSIRMLFAAICALTLSACMTFTLEGDGEKKPDATQGTDTTHGSLYGYYWSKPTDEKCTDGQQLFRVRFHTNAGYLLASVASLGLYVPQTAQWWCTDTTNAFSPDTELEEELYQPN